MKKQIENLNLSRRAFFPTLGVATVSLASCQITETTSMNSTSQSPPRQRQSLRRISEAPLPKTLTTQTQGFTPQFADGSNNTPQLIEIGYSLHCGGTREWLRNNGKKLASDLRSGRKAALFSHVVRSETELSVGIEVMRVGQERYPEAVYAAFGLILALNRPVSAQEMRQFLRDSGFGAARGFSEQNAEVALIGVLKAYHDGLGKRSTPIILNSQVG
ncbi:hypothetical protein MWU54_05820 [Marivita sp. S6314]|uniref:hypothetical protein n=1 Tax=Marivita sp. S6314 TaxID=2926406 RepID=UPI001FF653B3|nr:hypothetical protein [Marivita sp. S6314]MCK0149531.1 hypothetical protein [Marivita sp. S6314]